MGLEVRTGLQSEVNPIYIYSNYFEALKLSAQPRLAKIQHTRARRCGRLQYAHRLLDLPPLLPSRHSSPAQLRTSISIRRVPRLPDVRRLHHESNQLAAVSRLQERDVRHVGFKRVIHKIVPAERTSQSIYAQNMRIRTVTQTGTGHLRSHRAVRPAAIVFQPSTWSSVPGSRRRLRARRAEWLGRQGSMRKRSMWPKASIDWS